MKRKALGKGLSALLPDPEPADSPSAPADATGEVPTSELEPNPLQPRGTMEPARLDEYVRDLKQERQEK